MKKLAICICSLLLTAAVTAAPRTAPSPASGLKPVPRGKNQVYYIPRFLDGQIVTIACSDGYTLSADYIRRSRMISQQMPAILFIHGMGQDRYAWYPLTIQMAARGYAVLAIDLRGHGENPSTKGNSPVKAAKLTPEDFKKMLDDVRNAVSYLSMRPGVDPDSIGIVGASIGANLAVLAAAEEWGKKIKCLVLASPGMDYKGLAIGEAVKSLGKRHVYIAVGKGDTYSMEAANAIMPLLKGPKDLFQTEGKEHGTALVGKGLIQTVPLWCNQGIIAGNPRLAPRPMNANR